MLAWVVSPFGFILKQLSRGSASAWPLRAVINAFVLVMALSTLCGVFGLVAAIVLFVFQGVGLILFAPVTAWERATALANEYKWLKGILFPSVCIFAYAFFLVGYTVFVAAAVTALPVLLPLYVIKTAFANFREVLDENHLKAFRSSDLLSDKVEDAVNVLKRLKGAVDDGPATQHSGVKDTQAAQQRQYARRRFEAYVRDRHADAVCIPANTPREKRQQRQQDNLEEHFGFAMQDASSSRNVIAKARQQWLQKLAEWRQLKLQQTNYNQHTKRETSDSRCDFATCMTRVGNGSTTLVQRCAPSEAKLAQP